MPKLRVHNLSVSLDGYAAGPDQALDQPLGIGGPLLHEWVFATPTGRRMIGQHDSDEGAGGIDDTFLTRGDEGIGATIMGRNMFAPSRGPWPDDQWTGWWGEEPPYHHPVFVLTHHARPAVAMKGGTIFHFVNESIEETLTRAFDAADGDDVRLGGGSDTIRQYLRAGLVDEMHLAIVPVLLGSGERLFDAVDLAGVDGYQTVEFVASPSVMHVRLAKR